MSISKLYNPSAGAVDRRFLIPGTIATYTCADQGNFGLDTCSCWRLAVQLCDMRYFLIGVSLTCM